MGSVDLKPWPFCGRKPSKVRQHCVAGIGTIFYTVECKAPETKCAVKPKTRMFKTEKEAIEAWNRRVNDD